MPHSYDPKDVAIQRALAETEARHRGMSFLVDGMHVALDRIVVVTAEGSDNPIATMRRLKSEVSELLQAVKVLSGSTTEEDLWQHIRSKCVYELIGTASIKTEQPLEDMASVVVYRGENGSLWARRRDEFNDGRFRQVDSRALTNNSKCLHAQGGARCASWCGNVSCRG